VQSIEAYASIIILFLSRVLTLLRPRLKIQFHFRKQARLAF